MATSLNPAELSYLELSDSTTVPEGNAAPSLKGSSSSAEQLASETSPIASERGRSRCICSSEEKLATETTLPCEQGRNKCLCCKKRQFENDWTCDIIEGCMGEIVEAIGEFRELYQSMEFIKWECKKPKNDVLERIAKMSEEKEERLQKLVVEQQVVMAKMSEEKEEWLQKLVVEQQVVMAKMSEEKEEWLQKLVVEQQVVMAKMNQEKEERLQKFMMEQQVVMAKIIADAVKDAVGRRLDSPAE